MPISAQYDSEADALYIRLIDEPRERTIEVDETIYVDVDKDGRPIGIEVLYPSLGIAVDAIVKRFGLLERHSEIAAAIARSGAPITTPTVTFGSTHFASSSTTTIRVEGTVAASGRSTATGIARPDPVIHVGI